MLLKAIRPSYMSIVTENAKNKQYLRVHWQKNLAKQAWKIAQTARLLVFMTLQGLLVDKRETVWQIIFFEAGQENSLMLAWSQDKKVGE